VRQQEKERCVDRSVLVGGGDQCRESGLLTREVELPSLAEFGGRLARLTRVVEQIRQAGVEKVILVVLDEVDELNPAFYRGQRGEAFFGTLRALGEQGVVFVLVGSERMPLVFRRYGQVLNRYDTCQLDTIENAQDVIDMVKEPLSGFIEFGADAISLVARRSGGNPYYINLLCMRLLQAMVAARRTYVDAVDVNEAARSLAEDRAPTHWSHLWEDGDFDEEEAVARQREAAIVLAGFGREPVERGLRAKEVEALLREDCDGELPGRLNVEGTIEALVRRGVLHGEGAGAARQYNVKFEIFRWWLCENGRAQLLVPFKECAASKTEEDIGKGGELVTLGTASDFPVSDDELIRIAEGKENRIAKAGNVRRAADWLDNSTVVEGRERFVLFVDDFVGSGLQAAGLARAFVKSCADRPKVREALDQQRVAYLSLLAYRDGLASLTDEVGDSLMVETVEELDETDQAFAPEAEIFESEDDRSVAEAMCREIGSQLFPDNPLGWEDLQSLVVFPDSVPNATLPIFWRSGTVDGLPWKALFDR